MRTVYPIILIILVYSAFATADLFPPGGGTAQSPTTTISCTLPGPCTAETRIRGKKKCAGETFRIQARISNQKVQTRAITISECGSTDTGWVDGFFSNFNARCYAGHGKTCQCHKPWRSTCKVVLNRIGTDRIQLLNSFGGRNTPVLKLNGECTPGMSRCQGTSYFACENNVFVDKGEILGQCGVTPQLLCGREGGTILGDQCCWHADSFNTQPASTCERKTFTFFSFSIGTKPTCASATKQSACFQGRVIGDGIEAVAHKVINSGGSFIGCGPTPQLQGLADVKGGGLIKFLEPCSTVSVGNAKYLCTMEGNLSATTEDLTKGFISKQVPTPGISSTGASGCCPLDKCFTGAGCVGVGTRYTANNISLTCGIQD